MEPAVLTFGELGDPIVEARAETLREARQLLTEWEQDRLPETKGRLLATLESLRLLVRVDH